MISTEENVRHRAPNIARTLAVWLLPVLTACGGSAADRGRGDSTRVSAGPAAAQMESITVVPAAPTVSIRPADAPRVLFLGTSLTAGLGLADPQAQSWPGVIQQIADSVGVPLVVTNAGLSGETSAGALRRVDWLLRESYDMIVIETGANDGLRGVNADSTAANIAELIAKARATLPTATMLLVQMEAPTNMGQDYTRKFHDLFPRVARESGAMLLPFILEGVGGIPRFNQGDGIHPTAEGARMAASNVWPGIRYALRQR